MLFQLTRPFLIPRWTWLGRDKFILFLLLFYLPTLYLFLFLLQLLSFTLQLFCPLQLLILKIKHLLREQHLVICHWVHLGMRALIEIHLLIKQLLCPQYWSTLRFEWGFSRYNNLRWSFIIWDIFRFDVHVYEIIEWGRWDLRLSSWAWIDGFDFVEVDSMGWGFVRGFRVCLEFIFRELF